MVLEKWRYPAAPGLHVKGWLCYLLGDGYAYTVPGVHEEADCVGTVAETVDASGFRHGDLMLDVWRPRGWCGEAVYDGDNFFEVPDA